MMMFESGIFASFIPQILMVMAYISFFLAPSSKSDKADNLEQAVNETLTVLETKASIQNTFNFTDATFTSLQSLDDIRIIPLILKKSNSNYKFTHYSQFNSDSLFNRPPPLHFI